MNAAFPLKYGYFYFGNKLLIWPSRSLYGEKAMELPERTNEMAGVYARQCVELARELGLPSINLWSKMQETEGWQKKFLRLVMHKAFVFQGNFVACCFINLFECKFDP